MNDAQLIVTRFLTMSVDHLLDSVLQALHEQPFFTIHDIIGNDVLGLGQVGQPAADYLLRSSGDTQEA